MAVGKKIILKAFLNRLCTYIVELGREVWSSVSKVDTVTPKGDILSGSC